MAKLLKLLCFICGLFFYFYPQSQTIKGLEMIVMADTRDSVEFILDEWDYKFWKAERVEKTDTIIEILYYKREDKNGYIMSAVTVSKSSIGNFKTQNFIVVFMTFSEHTYQELRKEGILKSNMKLSKEELNSNYFDRHYESNNFKYKFRSMNLNSKEDKPSFYLTITYK